MGGLILNFKSILDNSDIGSSGFLKKKVTEKYFN